MQNSMEMKERRRRRSEYLQTAVTYQLEHIKEEYQLSCAGAANRDGLFAAGTENTMFSKTLAAYAPEIAEISNKGLHKRVCGEVKRHHPQLADDYIAVHKFSVDEEVMYLFASGSEETKIKDALEHAATGMERIFETT